jgi:hypothetical protein
LISGELTTPSCLHPHPESGFQYLTEGMFMGKLIVTIQLTFDLPDSGVKSAHIHLFTARFFPLEQITGNLNSYE